MMDIEVTVDYSTNTMIANCTDLVSKEELLIFTSITPNNYLEFRNLLFSDDAFDYESSALEY